MTPKAFENEFLKNLGLLNKEQQGRALTYIRALAKRAQNDNHLDLLQFAGSLSTKDAQEIGAAIETGCENIDRNEW